MRTRLVRVRRRGRPCLWAVIFMALAAAAYIRVSLPKLQRMQEEAADAVSRGERVTREATIGALQAHLVSLGSFSVESAARVEAARYVPRGAAGYVLEGDQLHVIGAGYETREEAERVCAQLAAQEGLECTVVSLSSPDVPLRMTAGSEQIASFILAEETLRSAVSALGRLSFSIDRGEATLYQARSVVRTQLSGAEAAHEALERQTEGAREGVFGEVLALLGDLCGRMEELLEAEGRMELSSGLKHCHAEFRVREIGMLNELLEE